MAIGAGELGDIVKSVAGVQPAVEPPGEGIAQAVSVALIAQGAVELLTLIRPAVAICVAKIPDVGNAEADHSIAVGIESHRYIQAICEGRNLVRTAIGIGIFENPDRISSLLFQSHGVGVLEGVADPQAPAGIEGDIQRLVNLWLTGKELDLETFRQGEALELLTGCLRSGLAHMAREKMRSRGMGHFPALLRPRRFELGGGDLPGLVQHQVGPHLAPHQDVREAVTADITCDQLGSYPRAIVDQPWFKPCTGPGADGPEPVENRLLLGTWIPPGMRPEPFSRHDVPNPISIYIHQGHRMHLRDAQAVWTVGRTAGDDRVLLEPALPIRVYHLFEPAEAIAMGILNRENIIVPITIEIAGEHLSSA